jgi:hypothetical protein
MYYEDDRDYETDGFVNPVRQHEQDRGEDCDGCKWWSELCARSFGCGPMEALCLNPNSPRYNKMVFDGCDRYEAGRAIDDPSC